MSYDAMSNNAIQEILIKSGKDISNIALIKSMNSDLAILAIVPIQ
ncbi:MAG: hypothetical protein QXZ17_09560 [Nitrososphaerota archaeon]